MHESCGLRLGHGCRYRKFPVLSVAMRGPGSSVDIATELRAGRSGNESRWGRDFPPVQTGPGAHPASCKMGTGSFSGAKSGRGVTLLPHLLLVPWSRKYSAIPLLPLWAVRPVQSLSACTRVHFTFYRNSAGRYAASFACVWVFRLCLRALLMCLLPVVLLLYCGCLSDNHSTIATRLATDTSTRHADIT